MKYWVATPTLVVLLCITASAQFRFGHGPQSLNQENTPPRPNTLTSATAMSNPTLITTEKNPFQPSKTDTEAWQRQAKSLLELSQAILADSDALKQGVLPKDTIEKLKRIQKTAKQMRNQISP